jgi:uncharacterized SAM-dependent methyltransferase
VLHAAYNDLERVTAAFTRNFLMRLKRDLAAAFAPDAHPPLRALRNAACHRRR